MLSLDRFLEEMSALYGVLDFFLVSINSKAYNLVNYAIINFVLFAVLIVLCVVILVNQIKIRKQLRQLLEDQSASRKAEESAPADES